jgi:hypothetical protein
MPAGRKAKRARRSLISINKHIQRSQMYSFIAQNDIDHSTVPAGVAKDPQSSVDDYEVDAEQHQGGGVEMEFDNDFESFAAGTSSDTDSESSLLEERGPGEDLPAGDSYSPEQQLHVMMGGDFQDDDRSQAEEDDQM